MTNAIPVREEVERTLAAEVLRHYGELRFVARGSSMIPSVYPGDLLTVRREQESATRRGELVLCVRENRFLLHRITRQCPKDGRLMFATQGDALRHEDPLVERDQLLGRVTSIVRLGKRIDSPQKENSWMRFLRWCVRNSQAVATSLLRWHSLRSRMFGAILENPVEKTLECM